MMVSQRWLFLISNHFIIRTARCLVHLGWNTKNGWDIITQSFGFAGLGAIEDEGVVVAVALRFLFVLLALLVFFLFFFLLAGLALPHCHVLRDNCAESNASLVVVTMMRFLFLEFGVGE